jgi:chemotaxis methyl-accepting protein methylase
MTEGALEDAARLLSRRVGLRLDPAVRGRLARAVQDEATRNGQELSTYVARLDGDADALQDLLNRVTVQETSFFRDAGQFDALASTVLPALREAGEPVRVWSAASANGQEPYSVAMVLSEANLVDWEVIATDISTSALARTRAARYHERELSGLSPERRRRYLREVGGSEWEVVPALREKVLVSRNNLAADPPPSPPRSCQVVFCRNVLIYFGRTEVVAFLERLSTWLPPGGYLFLGYSESLWQVTDRFVPERIGDAFLYRTRPAPAPASAARRAPRPAPVAQAPRPSRPAGRRATSPAPRPAPGAPPQDVELPVQPRAVADLLAEGEVALGGGEYAAAVAAFRKVTYLDPDQPVAHLNLALALEASGDEPSARRAYLAARAALDRCDTAEVEAALEGYHLDELSRLLDLKVGGA